jgi:predicted lipoprotein with Yx(FWY)xxD motif
MKKQLGVSLSVLALAATLSACGPSTGTTTTTAAAPQTSEVTGEPTTTATTSPTGTAAAEGAELKTAETSLGEIVVDGKGMSLYYFTKDTKDSGKSACEGQCLVAWPPLFTESDSPEVEGVTGEIGTIDSPDGKKHVTINGMPVYYYEKDKAPGDVTGQGVGNVWYVIAPDGEMIK